MSNLLTSRRILRPFRPDQVQGLALWLDASDASTLTLDGSNNVSQWRDKSGNNRHAVQGTSGSRPSGTSSINGKTALSFDGTDDRLTIPYDSGFDMDSYTIFGVVDNDQGAPTFRAWIERAPNASAANRRWWIGTNSSSAPYTVANSIVSPAIEGNIDLYSLAANQNPVSVCVTKNGATNATLHIDGSLIFTDTSVATISTNTNPTNIGGSSNYPWRGKIGEILIYSRALNSTERLAVESYLRTNWGTP